MRRAARPTLATTGDDFVFAVGAFGQQKVFGLDAYPAFLSRGEGPMDNPKLETKTSVRILNRFR